MIIFVEGGEEGGVKEDESNYMVLGGGRPSSKTAKSMYSKYQFSKPKI